MLEKASGGDGESFRVFDNTDPHHSTHAMGSPPLICEMWGRHDAQMCSPLKIL